MTSEWRQHSTVGEGGRVEIVIPELSAGDVVEVAVRHRTEDATLFERPLGLMKGRITIMPDFDDPLDEFENID